MKTDGSAVDMRIPLGLSICYRHMAGGTCFDRKVQCVQSVYEKARLAEIGRAEDVNMSGSLSSVL